MTDAETIAKLQQELADARAALQSKTRENPEERNEVVSIGAGNTPKLPIFWQRDPQLWFAQVEAQFHSHRIKADNTKYFTVVAALDSSVLQPVADIIANPPDEQRYETIKKKLIEAYTDSQERQIRKLLNELELGDKKPSQLMREMKALAGAQIQEDFLKTLWVQRLPTNVQLVLSGSDGVKLDRIAEMADKMVEIYTSNVATTGISAVSAANVAQTSETAAPPFEVTPLAVDRISGLEKQIATLTATLERLVTDRGRSHSQNKYGRRGRYRSVSRNRARGNEKEGELCYYHAKFGAAARKCYKPCNFERQEN